MIEHNVVGLSGRDTSGDELTELIRAAACRLDQRGIVSRGQRTAFVLSINLARKRLIIHHTVGRRAGDLKEPAPN